MSVSPLAKIWSYAFHTPETQHQWQCSRDVRRNAPHAAQAGERQVATQFTNPPTSSLAWPQLTPEHGMASRNLPVVDRCVEPRIANSKIYNVTDSSLRTSPHRLNWPRSAECEVGARPTTVSAQQLKQLSSPRKVESPIDHGRR